MEALSALGIAPENPTFPAVVRCPTCSQNTLYLFDDVLTEAVWLSCQSCGTHGDIITFAANLWNISVPDALTKFSHLSLVSPEVVDTVTPEYVKILARQQAARDFYADARAGLWGHGDDLVARRLRKLHVCTEIGDSIDFVGVTTHEKVMEICTAVGRAKQPRVRKDGAIVVFPFYDLPKRLTGFLLLQYTDEGAAQYSFIPIDHDKTKRPEAGYLMLEGAIMAPLGPCKNTQIIADDLLWAVEAQCRQLMAGSPMLPVMAAYSGPEAESYGVSWRSYNKADRIFVGPIATPSLISRACNAGGYISVTHLGRMPGGAAQREPNIKRISSARKNAQTWQNALYSILYNANDIAAQSFIRQLTIPPEKLALFFKKTPHNLPQASIDQALIAIKQPAGPPTKMAAKKNWTVVEHDRCWWTKSGGPICNIQPVILRIYYSDDGDRTYVGKIFFRNEVYDFTAPANKLEKAGLLAYAAAELVAHKRVVVFDQTWNHKSHLLAQQLHPPEIIRVSRHYGWDESANVFRFDKYELTPTGEVQLLPEWPNNKREISFPEITPIAPVTIHELLGPAHENSFTWAVFSVIAAHLLAPVFQKQPAATAVCSADFDAAALIAKALSCPIEQTTAGQYSRVSNILRAAADRHSWPVAAFHIFNENYFCSAVPRCHTLPVIIKMSDIGASAACGYGWNVLRGGEKQFKNVGVLNYVLPAYIQHVLASRGRAFLNPDNFALAVLEHVHQWLETLYGKTFNLPHAKTKFIPPAAAHSALCRSVARAVAKEQIAVLPKQRSRKQAQNYILREQDAWWLSRGAINGYFFRECRLTPNWFTVVDLLQQNSLYLGEKSIHNVPGILLPVAWTDKFFDACLDTAKEIG